MPYLRIEPVTSPVLIANITDNTGTLYHPLSTIFRVITNGSNPQKLYLSAAINTDGGRESAMFRQGGRVYVAFGNLRTPPTLKSLLNCKNGNAPMDSPGVVAYPITSITGAKPRYLSGKEKYEMEVKNGTTYITVNIGQNVLRNSFATNDPKGPYQAILMLTESDS